MSFCSYYQAKVDKPRTWFIVATIRSYDHLCFDRTLDVENGIFEFFVPKDMENDFLKIIKYYQETGIISDLKKLKNRLEI
jgi:hypothetical protein